MSQPAHALSFDQVAEELKADVMNGLNETEASQRLETFGNNDLGDAEGIQPLKIILAQVANAMTLVSLSLGVLSLLFVCLGVSITRPLYCTCLYGHHILYPRNWNQYRMFLVLCMTLSTSHIYMDRKVLTNATIRS